MWWNGPLNGFGWHPWWMLSHAIVSILLLGIMIAALIALGRSISGSGRGLARRRSPGLDVLDMRFARGEIDAEEYRQKKEKISDRGVAS